MGVANEHAIRLAQDKDETFSFQDEFLRRYPGLCTQCGFSVCVCPSVPAATIGRMAKEIEIAPEEQPFTNDLQTFERDGRVVAHRVLELQGGYNGLSTQFPIDRGDANRALILLCNGIADAVERSNPDLASALRAEAFKIGTQAQSAGTVREPLQVEDLQKNLARAWKEMTLEQKEVIKTSRDDMMGGLAKSSTAFEYCLSIVPHWTLRALELLAS